MKLFGRFVGLVVFLATVFSFVWIWQYRTIPQTAAEQFRTSNIQFAQYMHDSLLKILMEAESGGAIIDKLLPEPDDKNQPGISVRMIHSDSINKQYKYEEHEQVLTVYERLSLSDGKRRYRETRDHFISIIPFNATEKCLPCHHMPGTENTPVPLGYTLGLVELKTPNVMLKQTRDDLFFHNLTALGIIMILLVTLGYSTYNLMALLQKRNEELQSALDNLNATQEQLIRSEKLASIASVAAGMAHEIKNPLNIISTTTQLMMMEEGASEEQMKSHRTVMEQVDRSSKIIDGLRDFAKGKKPETSRIDLHQLLKKVVSAIEDHTAGENIAIEQNYHSEPIVIEADPVQLERVFLNIITNAVDSIRLKRKSLAVNGSKAADRLAIATGIEGNEVFVRFNDTGTGMSKETMKHVFDPFFTTKTDEVVGTGMGLAFAYGIINNHGGRIEVSAREGEGSEFKVVLPASTVQAPRS